MNSVSVGCVVGATMAVPSDRASCLGAKKLIRRSRIRSVVGSIGSPSRRTVRVLWDAVFERETCGLAMQRVLYVEMY